MGADCCKPDLENREDSLHTVQSKNAQYKDFVQNLPQVDITQIKALICSDEPSTQPQSYSKTHKLASLVSSQVCLCLTRELEAKNISSASLLPLFDILIENLSSKTDEKVVWALSLLYTIESLTNKSKDKVCGVPLSCIVSLIGSLSGHQDEFIAYWSGKFLLYILANFDFTTPKEYILNALNVFYTIESTDLYLGHIKNLKKFIEGDKYWREIEKVDIFKYLPNSESSTSNSTCSSLSGSAITTKKAKLMMSLETKMMYKDRYVSLSKQKR